MCAATAALVTATGKLTVVFGYRFFITGGDLGRIGIADRAALLFIEFAAQLQFKRVHFADQLLVHLLDQGRIAAKTARIQITHLIDQGLQLLPRLRIILHDGANLVEQVQSLVDLALGIGWVGTLLGRRGPVGESAVSGVDVAIHGAITIAAPGCSAVRTAHAVADIT